MNSAGWPARSIAWRMSGMRLVTPVDVSLWTTSTALIRVRAILGQLGLDDRRIDAAAPVAGHEVDHQAELLGHRPPQRREMARLEHQHAIARRQRVDERGFPGAGARRRVDHDRPRGLEDRLQALQDFQRQLRELGTPMVDGRLVHRPQDAVGHVGGPGNLQEMAAGRMRIELNMRASDWNDAAAAVAALGIQNVVYPLSRVRAASGVDRACSSGPGSTARTRIAARRRDARLRSRDGLLRENASALASARGRAGLPARRRAVARVERLDHRRSARARRRPTCRGRSWSESAVPAAGC